MGVPHDAHRYLCEEAPAVRTSSIARELALTAVLAFAFLGPSADF